MEKKITEETIVPEWFFEERKNFSMRFLYSTPNEKFSNLFVNKIEDHTNGKVKLVIIWSPCKTQSLFDYKDKVQNLRCVIYHSVCSCGRDYIVENIRNSKIRWREYCTGREKNSYCVKHLKDNFNHEFQWFV